MPSSSPRRNIDHVLIRPATVEDVPVIRMLERQAETAAHWAEREYDSLLAPDAPKRIVLVAVNESDEAQIHGFVIVRCALTTWEIENLVVAAEQSRLGIGTQLIKELLLQSLEGGATSVLLEVRPSNVPARRLYEKLGFTEGGRRVGYYRDPQEDALLLQISIPSGNKVA